FTRNNCEKNFIGSNVTYTATATKTATAETQAKADELATTAAQSAVDEDILANGQNFANTNGTCTQTTFEATKSFTAKETVEKNDCKVGEIPSKVEVSITKEATATADTQVKADEKALDEATKLAKTELEKIKQTEANKNGTCKKKAIEEPKPTPKPEKPTKPEKEPIKLIPRKANGSACDDCFKVKDDKNVIIENTVVTVKTDTTKEIKKVKEVQKEVKNKEKKPEVKEEKKSVDKEKMMKIAQEMVKQENAIIQALEKIQKEIDKLSLQQELPQEVQTQPVTDFKKYPKRLPRTGILDLETIKVLRDFRVETDLDEKYLKLAGADNKALNFWKQSLPKEDKTKDASAYIVIPKRGMVVPISQLEKESEDYQSYLNGVVNDFLPYLENGAVELPGSKKLPYGSMTNKFIAGHSSDWKATKGRYKTHFQQIIATEEGDEIYIYEKQNDGSYKLYEYEVKKSYETVEGDNSPLKHIPGKKQLTLATCTPIGGNSGRWIVKAELKEDSSNMEHTKNENSVKKLQELRMQKQEGEANLASYQVSAKDSRLAHKVIAFINKKDEAVKTELFFRLFEILQSKQDKNNFLAYLEFLIAKQIVR
ncbi:sortase, partial [Candidatus Gracilibacteria bacterium]|nr:sortase [Candidatus Gracilibacteria bacterium]